MKNDFESLVEEIQTNKDVQLASIENSLRRNIAAILEAQREKKGLSLRNLAKETGTSLSQIQRVLHKEHGGNLTLRTLIRVADALGLSVTIKIS